MTASTTVAVIGSGVAGLGAAWLLTQGNQNKDRRYTVTLYERDGRAGGHSNTVDYRRPSQTRTGAAADQKSSSAVPVDCGFIVFNDWTYPNLLRFFDALRVRHQPSDMSFAVSRDRGAFEWAGDGLHTLFAQRRNLFSVRFWQMLADIVRFNQLAVEHLLVVDSGVDGGDGEDEVSIGQYLDWHGYSRAFAEDYLIPMTAAIWSTAPDQCWRDFPARTLVRFMHNHGLLQVFGRPLWRTVSGGRSVP